MISKGMISIEEDSAITKMLAEEAETVFADGQPKEQWTGRMLVIIPDLHLTGTLTVLTEMFQLFEQKGYRLYVIASEDGEYREKLIQAGAVVAIRPYVGCTERYRHFLQTAFDCVFVNSAACYYYIYYFINTGTKTIWWLHETRTQLETMKDAFPHPGLLSSNIRMAGVTGAVCRGMKELYGVQISDLPMPVRDCGKDGGEEGKGSGKTLFFIPAAYTYIKGQDLLLQAISQLPGKFPEQSEFVFCGYQLPGQMKYYDKIKNIAALLKNVTFLDALDKEEVYQWYQKCDCVIAPSRVDATPTTIVEAMMFGKLCIVSGAAGISEYMQDCINGFVFPAENVGELLKRIMLVIADKEKLAGVAGGGRKIYEDHFSVPAVLEKLELLDGEIF